jgi:acetyl-CoA carboxylase carboxyl transferase subunit beta
MPDRAQPPAGARPGHSGPGSAPDAADWRADLLAAVTPRPPARPAPNRLDWPGYASAPAVWWGEGTVAGTPCVVAVWEFAVFGGSFGEADATTFTVAAERAAATGRPLVSFLRSGGTRLQEGVAGLVGLARATLAADRLDEAGVVQLAVVDQPTTGGVWVTVASRADLRCAVDGATVGFAGPRVVAATTGTAPGPGSHSAASAHTAGLVDAVVTPDGVEGWLRAALAAATCRPAVPATRPAAPATGRPVAGRAGDGRAHCADDGRTGWDQVLAARAPGRPGAGACLDALLPGGLDLAGTDAAVRARLGLVPAAAGAPAAAVGVALATAPGGAPGPGGFRLLERAARLAGKLGLPLVTFVDTPGADPSPAAEAGGVAVAIGAAMGAVLRCPSPTVAVVVGEGGSGGALAATCADVVLMTPDSYLTALSPEGAATTLRTTAQRAADLGGLRPAELLRLGFADDVLGTGVPGAVAAAVAAALADLAALGLDDRLAARRERWSTALPGRR